MHEDKPKTEAEGERVVYVLTRATCAERLEVECDLDAAARHDARGARPLMASWSGPHNANPRRSAGRIAHATGEGLTS